MKVTFWGAAGEVTGSKHIVELAGSRILLDCGAFQGRRRESREKNKQLGFDSKSIDAVVVSHAHFDHVGLLPVLVKGGFRGKIVSTAATRDLTELILLDASHIQEQDAAYVNRHKLPDADLVEPLYTAEDIPAVMKLFESVPYVIQGGDWYQLTQTVQVKLYDAGHILGSAVTVLSGSENGRERHLLYTGDLGRPHRVLLRDPQTVQEPIDVAITESTYGIRPHSDVRRIEDQLIDAVNTIVRTKGRILVPAFSMGRTQQLVYILHELTDQKKVPRIPMYVDSPLAGRITEVFTRHQLEYDAESKTDFGEPGEDPLAFRNLTYTQSVDESKELNEREGPCLVISASGMLSGGRIMHHLRRHLSDPTTIVLFTGYQAQHTPGRRMIKGAKNIHIFGQPVPVKAEIRTINDLSAHADADDISTYLGAVPSGPRYVALTHGENSRRQDLAAFLKTKHPDWKILQPNREDQIEIP